MRLILLPLLIVATPAMAQIWDGGRSVARPAPRQLDPDAFARSREARGIDRSIRDGVRRGELTRREGRELRAQAGAIGRTSGGLSAGIGPQQTTALLGLRGLVDARRAQGRERKAGR
ncbi:hypothetical protein ASG37_09070 [Sphingomonas sp. Leaf407]|uniref:hypothetical protein n=1 Tax=unclassified Sphingomonas TaxID=196159 RepID=UPI0006F79F6D|nr:MULTISPECIES: hypothetical protein [unclassified Sphingomonas]KQN39674.1 hypothetical protein ASE97_06360 [Sphingomonas sp. Leaf42]KQT28949.1 hypothetical protein ASG37_09070 [Sphingomonas sp. Leaf407]